MKNQPIIVEKTFNAPVSKVWDAITDKDQMKQWYIDLPEFRAEVGFKFRFVSGPSPERQYTHLCEVTEVVPENRLTHSWKYEGYSGNSFVTFELNGRGDKTVLRLTHEGIDSFPKENTDFVKKNFVEGWNEILGKALKDYLEPA